MPFIWTMAVTSRSILPIAHKIIPASSFSTTSAQLAKADTHSSTFKSSPRYVRPPTPALRLQINSAMLFVQKRPTLTPAETASHADMIARRVTHPLYASHVLVAALLGLLMVADAFR